jgi:hypothetical protein
MAKLAAGLTPLQIKIYELRANGNTYDEIIERIQLEQDPSITSHMYGHEAVRKALKRTVLGHVWGSRLKGGRMTYLCLEDREAFLKEIQERADTLNCITTYEALNLAIDIHNTRVLIGVELLRKANSSEMANTIFTKYFDKHPEKDYLRQLCSIIHVSVFSAQKLSYFRRKYCSANKIEKFFQKHSHVLNQSPLLIFNADETIVKSNKSFKVLAPNEVTPVSPLLPQLPHYSAMICVSASGFKMKPMFICPHFKNIPNDLIQFQEEALFISNRSGWMTKRIFLIWVHFFIYNLSIYKQTLPPELRNERFLLLLDGHSSRSTFEAIYLLERSCVDVLIFPPHSTHIIQPVDVSINSPLKIQFQKNLYQLAVDNELFSLSEQSNLSSASTWRTLSIEAFLNAFDTSANRKNIKSGFRATGIVPLDKQIPLSNALLAHPFENNQLFQTNRFSISNKLLSTKKCIAKLRDARDFLFPIQNNMAHSMFDQWNFLNSENDCDGKILGGPEAFFWYENHPHPDNTEISRIPTPFVQQLYAYRQKNIDDIQTLLEHISGKDVIFLTEHISQSVTVDKLLTSLNLPHYYCNGKTSRIERVNILKQFNETAHGKLVTTYPSIIGYDFPKRVFIVYWFIPTKATQLRHREDTLIYIYKYDKDLEQLAYLKLKPYELLL